MAGRREGGAPAPSKGEPPLVNTANMLAVFIHNSIYTQQFQ